MEQDVAAGNKVWWPCYTLTTMNKQITPNLWFDGNAKEAVDFYISVFPDSKIISTNYYPNSEKEGLADSQTELAGKVWTQRQ